MVNRVTKARSYIDLCVFEVTPDSMVPSAPISRFRLLSFDPPEAHQPPLLPAPANSRRVFIYLYKIKTRRMLPTVKLPSTVNGELLLGFSDDERTRDVCDNEK